jgi:hypothetical protein
VDSAVHLFCRPNGPLRIEKYCSQRRFLLALRHLTTAVRAERPREQVLAVTKMLKASKQAPPDGSTHWCTRKLAGHLGVSHSRVDRGWARPGIQPHRIPRCIASADPEFEEKGADVIGLYFKPPLNAAVSASRKERHPSAGSFGPSAAAGARSGRTTRF